MAFPKPKDLLVKDLTKILVTGAFEGELDILIKSRKFPHTKALGIGNLEAGLNLLSYLQANQNITTVYFLGSCGYYSWKELKIGGIFIAHQFRNFELSTALGHSKQIDLVPNKIDTLPLLTEYPSAICNAPSSLTLMELKSPPNIAWSELALENLEVFGVARGCQMLSIEFNALLTITNEVGPEGSITWQKNWRNCSNQLQESFLAVI